MRATIVGTLERKLNDRFSKIASKTIADNSFEKIDIVAAWLEKLFVEKISGKKCFRNFEKAIAGCLKTTLQEGDEYYFGLFRQEKIINKNTANRELSNPFTSAVQDIYNSLFKNNHSFAEGLTVYDELRLQIEREIGKLLAVDSTLQKFRNWLKVYEKLAIEHGIYKAWIRNIPLNSIIAEKGKFSLIKKAELNDLAHLSRNERNNKAEAKNYIHHLKEIFSKNTFEYITYVTRGSDLLTLKSQPKLQQTLVSRLEISDKVLFVDSLHYPILQDHAFLSITELSEYPEIIGEILKNKKLKTPKEHLLLIVLGNYYDFIARTITDLSHLSKRNYYDEDSVEIEHLKIELSDEYNLWLKEYIPSSFDKILNEVFPDAELSKSRFFLLFFEWLNSHSKLHLIHKGNESKKCLIDLLNDLFLLRLGSNKSDRHFLVDNLQNNHVSYETLRKLISIYEENKDDLHFTDKLYYIYLCFISSESFNWHASENVDFEEAINNAYNFSKILCSYDDGVKKWSALFRKHKTNHEGWLFTYADYKIYQRESFLLTAGIGIAYFKYSHTKTEAATDFYNVIDMLIQQQRNAGEIRSVDYVTPLKFAAITIGCYSPANSEDFAKLISAKFDGLKYLLIIISELKEYNKTLSFSGDFKKQISSRITNEFWVLENRKSDLLLKQSLDYYKALKENAMEICNKIESCLD
jgi:hypothetical protein